MACKDCFFLLLLYSAVASSLGFGPRFDSLKGGYGAGSNHHLDRLRCRASNSEEDHHEESYSLHFEPRYETGDGGELTISRLFISQPFVLHASMFGVKNPFDIEPLIREPASPSEQSTDLEDGSDQDCAIPEEYKRFAEEREIDVMDYLGLKRAEPLKVSNGPSETDELGEWE